MCAALGYLTLEPRIDKKEEEAGGIYSKNYCNLLAVRLQTD
jgi:hypothetical protein